MNMFIKYCLEKTMDFERILQIHTDDNSFHQGNTLWNHFIIFCSVCHLITLHKQTQYSNKKDNKQDTILLGKGYKNQNMRTRMISTRRSGLSTVSLIRCLRRPSLINNIEFCVSKKKFTKASLRYKWAAFLW